MLEAEPLPISAKAVCADADDEALDLFFVVRALLKGRGKEKELVVHGGPPRSRRGGPSAGDDQHPPGAAWVLKIFERTSLGGSARQSASAWSGPVHLAQSSFSGRVRGRSHVEGEATE